MGANTLHTTFPGTLDREALRTAFRDLQERAGAEHGTHAYGGNWYQARGLTITGRTFPTVEAATDYVCDTAEKRGPALAVRAATTVDQSPAIVLDPPTGPRTFSVVSPFDGFAPGGQDADRRRLWDLTRPLGDYQRAARSALTLHLASRLDADARAALTAVVTTLWTAHTAFRRADDAMEGLVRDWDRARRANRTLATVPEGLADAAQARGTAGEAFETALAAYQALHPRLLAEHYPRVLAPGEPVWVVGAVVPS